MDNTSLLIWLKQKAADVSAELMDTKERVKILEIQNKIFNDMIAQYEQKNNSPADTLASTQDYHITINVENIDADSILGQARGKVNGF